MQYAHVDLSIQIQFNIHKISSSFFCSWQRLKIPGSPLHLAYHHSSGCSVIVCTVSSGCRVRQKKHMDSSHTSVSSNNFPLHPLNGNLSIRNSVIYSRMEACHGSCLFMQFQCARYNIKRFCFSSWAKAS